MAEKQMDVFVGNLLIFRDEKKFCDFSNFPQS